MHWLSFDSPGLIPKHTHVGTTLAVKLDDRLQPSTALSTSGNGPTLAVAEWT